MIILTGASGGIGKEIAGILSNSHDIIGIYNKSKPIFSNDRVLYEKVDLLNSVQIKEFINKWRGKLSKVVFIHAAAMSIDGLAMNYKKEDWDHVMNVNLKGSFLFTMALLPFMIAQKWGRIINLSSIVGQQGAVGTIAYSASKSALVGMTKVLALEYGRFNITSNILALGYFQGGLINSLQDKAKQEIKKKIPMNKFGEIENVAHAIDFLIKSDYTNGAIINIDGGISSK